MGAMTFAAPTSGVSPWTGSTIGRIGAVLVATTALTAPFAALAADGKTSPRDPASAQQAQATSDRTAFDIESQPLADALDAFSDITGWQIGYTSTLVEGATSPGVQGPYAPDAALRQLLAGTGLTYRMTSDSTVTLAQAPAPENSGPQRLGPVTVTASRAPRPQSAIPGAVTVIDEEELDKQRAITRDVQRILQQSVPGFRGPTGNRQSGFTALRGRGALVLINGVPQNQQLRSAGYDFNNIDARQIERIEVVRGANATYGFGGSGGLINIITKKPKSDEPLYTFEVGTSFPTSNVRSDSFTREAFASVEGKAGDFDYLLSGSFRDLEDGYDAEGDRIPDSNMQFNSNVYDLQVSLGWQIDQEKSLRLDANYFRDQDDEDKTAPANAIVGERKADAVPAEQASPFFPTGKFADPQESKNVQLTYDDSDVLGSAVTVQGFWQQWENETFADFRSFGACCVLDFGTDKRIDRRLGTRVNIDSPFEYGPLPNGTRLVWGGDYLNLFNSELIDSRVAGTEVGTRPDITQNSVAGFAQLEVPVGEFLVSGGARHEVFFVDFDDQLRSDGTRFQGGGIQYDATLANLGLVYYLTDTVELFGGWSQGFDVTEAGRAASQVDTVDQIELEPAVTDQFELGVRVFESSWDASLTGFYTESELASRTQINPNGSLAIPLRQPEQIWGLEATLNTTINPEWTLGGTLHFQEGTREVDGDTKRVQSRFIQPWRVTGYAEYEPFDWFSNRLQFSFAPGHDRFPGSTAFGEGEVSDLFLLDYFASFQTDYGEFRLGVENITNAQYIPQFREATNVPGQYYAAQGRTVRLTYRVQF